MNNALHKVRRYIIVEITGTHEEAQDVVKRLEALAAGGLRPGISYWGCDGCGCPTKNYSPMEMQPCEDELCGHNCDTCGCIKFCIICDNEVGSNEDYCSLECRGAKRQ